MSEEPVTKEDVKEVAKQFAVHTVIWFIAMTGFGLLLKMIEKQGMMSQAYIPEMILATTLVAVLFTVLLIFCWGFVVYLCLQYLIDRGDTDE